MRHIQAQTGYSKNYLMKIGKVIVGQREAVEQILIAIMCNSHALVESNPDLQKHYDSTVSRR